MQLTTANCSHNLHSHADTAVLLCCASALTTCGR
jgi:hypothetical protein